MNDKEQTEQDLKEFDEVFSKKVTVYVLIEYTIHNEGETIVYGVVDSEEKAKAFEQDTKGLGREWRRSYEEFEVE